MPPLTSLSKYAATLIISVFPIFAVAMDVKSYEDLIEESDLPGEQHYLAKGMIETYFIGVTETLQYLQWGSSKIYLQGEPVACLPTSTQLSSSLVRGIVDGEISRNSSLYERIYGKRWKEQSLIAIVIPGLMRTFPCSK